MLERHPSVEPWLMEHRADSAEQPRPRGHSGPPRIACTGEAVREAQLGVVFLATPPEVSMELTPAMLEAGAKVVDLSGAFRLRTVENYAKWYKEEHTQPALLAEAAYGLPEFFRDQVRQARLVANPGCYPTAANLALRPLVEAGVIDRARRHRVRRQERRERRRAQAQPEDQLLRGDGELLGLLHLRSPSRPRSAADLRPGGGRVQFYRSSAPRGPRDPGDDLLPGASPATTPTSLVSIYEDRYHGEPFVRLYDPGQLPDLRAVRHTNYCDIGVKVDAASGRAVVVSVIDNLVKGAAGQAVQNMNLMLGYPETEGIL